MELVNSSKSTQDKPPLTPRDHTLFPKRWVIYPESRFQSYWDFLISACVMTNLILLPMNMSFKFEDQMGFRLVDVGCDLVFVIDVFVNFRCAFYVYVRAEKFMVDDPKRMTRKYLKSWFFIDLLSCGVPFANIENNYVKALAFFKVFRIIKVIRVLDRLANKLTLVWANVFRMVKILFLFLLLAHFSACLWYYQGREQKLMTGEGWITFFGFDDGQGPVDKDMRIELYLASFYWAIVSLCTTGYGDIRATNRSEQVTVCVVLLIGAVLYAFIFGNVTVLLQNLDLSHKRFQARMEISDEFCRIYAIGPELAGRIRQHLEYSFDLTKGFQVDDALTDLPVCMQTEIKMSMFEPVLKQIPFFKDASRGFLRCMVSKVEPFYLMAHEHIFEKGDLSREMFMVQRGSVQVLGESEQVLATLGPGSFFGEIGLFVGGVRTASARAATVCHLYSLGREGFEEVLSFYPYFAEVVRDAAKIRLGRDDTRAPARMAETVGGRKTGFTSQKSKKTLPQEITLADLDDTPATFSHANKPKTTTTSSSEATLISILLKIKESQEELNARLSAVEQQLGSGRSRQKKLTADGGEDSSSSIEGWGAGREQKAPRVGTALNIPGIIE